MSDVFYPLSLVERLDRARVDMTLQDAFESGATSSRLRWAAQSFKRKFKLLHAPLTRQEYRYLRSFHSQRSGGYDSFWIRDNVRREGNAKVRFAADLQDSFQGAAMGVQIDLDEVAPVRALPEWDEIATAAGNTPFYWHDPCREIYYLHAGTAYAGESSGILFDPLLGSYVMSWQAGSTLVNLGGVLAQAQYLAFDGTGWAKTSSNAGLATTKPAASVFLLARHSAAPAAHEILVSVGAGAGAIGVSYSNADTAYHLLKDGAQIGTGYVNGVLNTWRSYCATYVSASNNASFFANGTATDTNNSTTRTYSAGPIVLGALSNGTGIANTGAMANDNIAQVLVFAAALTQAQIKAVHNLFASGYGMATV